jgi:ribosomal protein S18 acetylase RimI-like enzyme
MLDAVQVQTVDRRHASQAVQLLGELRLSLFGIRSQALHAALVADGLARRIDFRIAVESENVLGVVVAAAPSYWITAPLTHWRIALECVRARAAADRSADHATPARDEARFQPDVGAPLRSWRAPGDAWRIILIGTDPAARGRGVAAELYRAVMADRSLVARIALDNAASLRLHRSLGWRVYRDGDVALAVHVRQP